MGVATTYSVPLRMSSSLSATSSRPAHAGSGRAVYRTLCATLVLLLGACAAPGPGPTTTPAETFPTVDASAPEALLARAERAGATEAALLRLRAAEAWADAGRLALLAGVLEALDEAALPPDARPRLTLLRALDALERGDADRALVLLRATPDARFDSALDAPGVVRASRIRGRVYAAADRPLEAVREWVFVEGLLEDPEERRAVREALWRTLTRLDPERLAQTLAGLGNEPVLRGWLELAEVALGLHPTLEAQLEAVDRWRRRWPGHPAADPLPERIARLPALLEGRPRRVALLLPLTGPLAAAGDAVRDGFLAAHFEALGTGAATPRITVFDTAAQAPDAAYLRAVDAGAELVVGPLAKDAVDAVAALPAREVPVLALNTASGASAAPDLLQFGLLPEDEGRQIAELAHGAGHRRALAVVDRAPWAQRLADAFRDHFEDLGGEVVATRSFSAARDIGDAVADGLLVHDSEARARELRRVLGDRFEFEPRPRSDLDFVFAGVDPVAGRTLKPALEYYFAGNLPVYASSHVHDGGVQDEDLDGIRFCDMPWRLVAVPTRQEIERAGEDTGRNAAFHALGVDAWRLHARLDTLRAGDPVAGVTGTLRLDPEGRLRRSLDWAIIRSGRAVPLPRVAAAGP